MRAIQQRVGFRRSFRVMAFIVAWATARVAWENDHPGEVFGIAEYLDWWGAGVDDRTAFRDQLAFREAFPEYDTPDPIIDLAIAQRCSVQELSWSP